MLNKSNTNKKLLKIIISITLLVVFCLTLRLFDLNTYLIEVITAFIIRVYYFFHIATILLLLKTFIISIKLYLIKFITTLTFKKGLFLFVTGTFTLILG